MNTRPPKKEENAKFPKEEEILLMNNEIHVRTNEFWSRYIFPTTKDAKSIFDTINSTNDDFLGGEIKKFVRKGDKLIEESITYNKTNINANTLQQKICALRFAISLYKDAYYLTEHRPWWCSSRYLNIAEYEKTLQNSDAKNKYKFSMFLSYEKWVLESTWASEFYANLAKQKERNDIKKKIENSPPIKNTTQQISLDDLLKKSFKGKALP